MESLRISGGGAAYFMAAAKKTLVLFGFVRGNGDSLLLKNIARTTSPWQPLDLESFVCIKLVQTGDF